VGAKERIGGKRLRRCGPSLRFQRRPRREKRTSRMLDTSYATQKKARGEPWQVRKATLRSTGYPGGRKEPTEEAKIQTLVRFPSERERGGGKDVGLRG